MKLIVGLGNPGEKYKSNRHNVGYIIVDKLKAQMSNVKTAVVVKTNTFMNRSGDFVRKSVDQYRLKVSNLWVIHDDLDIRLGDYKIQFGKGPKEHKGILSIEEALGTKDFWRVRIGVDNRDLSDRTPGEEYVLQDFTPEEILVIDEVVKRITKELRSIVPDM